jgi:thiaminase
MFQEILNDFIVKYIDPVSEAHITIFYKKIEKSWSFSFFPSENRSYDNWWNEYREDKNQPMLTSLVISFDVAASKTENPLETFETAVKAKNAFNGKHSVEFFWG